MVASSLGGSRCSRSAFAFCRCARIMAILASLPFRAWASRCFTCAVGGGRDHVRMVVVFGIVDPRIPASPGRSTSGFHRGRGTLVMNSRSSRPRRGGRGGAYLLFSFSHLTIDHAPLLLIETPPASDRISFSTPSP